MSERVCANPPCEVVLTTHRRHARFCSGACRAEGWRREHEKPHRTLSDEPRRASRDGYGTRIYLAPDEVADLVTRYGAEPGSRRMMEKVARAARVVDQRAGV